MVKTWGCKKMAEKAEMESPGNGITSARIRQRLGHAEINNPQLLRMLGIYKNDTGWQIPVGLIRNELFLKKGPVAGK